MSAFRLVKIHNGRLEHVGGWLLAVFLVFLAYLELFRLLFFRLKSTCIG